ncbi:bacteriohemerythrin [Azospirillum doebereinerae]|uniref:Hemerythrin n=1 Tax=Azospirillum doebereinerae TaxID=92933 RepID=A0A433J7E5_9PROT|nr:bacteriohemerythrin [Azospirillum doebereinerae]MCG5243081.1 bacteriohemerythrin [Azospirillum doebereinerae]RUQ69321.1 hemerythrin [Azospirillum doebereinerae]
MTQVAWDESMSVGVAVLDDEHKTLLDLFNGLLDGGITPANREELSALLTSLRAYVAVHFAREETLMLRRRYPDLDAHLAAHRYFAGEVEKLQHDFEGDNTTMLRMDLILLLKEWFIEHIQETDALYKPFLAGESAVASVE